MVGGESTGSGESNRGTAASRWEWLEEIYENQLAALTAYLRRKYGAGPPDPEDVCQQAFLNLTRLDDEGIARIQNTKAFLYRAAENILISEKRREVTRQRHAADALVIADDRTGSDSDIESVLVSKDELSLIESVIAKMPERRKQCFLLHRMEGLTFAEIGRQMNFSAPAARKHVERGLLDIEQAMMASASGGEA